MLRLVNDRLAVKDHKPRAEALGSLTPSPCARPSSSRMANRPGNTEQQNKRCVVTTPHGSHGDNSVHARERAIALKQRMSRMVHVTMWYDRAFT